jgi:1-aminocyclopropane-1-carboxylate deaminase/D-cysteine desulfhydrase-like pyridoxal-dependent ACC family enzyme
MNLQNSPIEKIKFNEFEYYIKRDDLLNNDFSGNKARKFYHFLVNDFPNIKKVVSHGSAQSNAMYSLSVLCKLKNWNFEYYVDSNFFKRKSYRKL